MSNPIIQWLVSPGLLPHGYCLAWAPGLLWTLVVGNALIGLAYFSIPMTLVYFVRQHRELRFNWVFVMFSIFIFACGTTHFINILNIWIPVYRLDATLMALAAAISVVTAIAIWPLAPRASAFLKERIQSHDTLQAVNRRLEESMRLLEQRSQQAEESERRFRLTLDNAPIGLAIVSLEGRFATVNQALCAMLGYTDAELRARTFQDITHPDDLQEDLNYVQNLLDGRRDSYRMEKRYFHRQGQIINIQLDVAILRDDAGAPVHFISQIQDISVRKSYEETLHEAKELAQVTLSSIGDGVIRTDAAGVITFCNAAAAKILEVPSERLVGQQFRSAVELYRGESQVRVENPVAQVLASGESLRLDLFSGVRTAGGEMRPISDSISPVRDIAGRVIGAVFVFQDVSDARKLTDRLSYQARHDLLTGLPNRLAFEEALVDCVTAAREGRGRHFLMYLDLDHFKMVNDTRGHAAGDRLLREVSTLLQGYLPEGDYFARLGGDEFAVILRDADAQEAQRLADSLIAALGGYRLRLGDRQLKVGLSIGISMIHAGNCDPSMVMAQADTACYAAKDQGRGRYQIYQADDAEILLAERTLDWAQRIQSAFDDNRFEVYLQEIVDRDRRLLGYESLIRMRGDNGHIIMPGSFIPAAQRMGWMSRIDQWMLREVLALARRRHDGTAPQPYLSLNLSARSVGDPAFIDWMLPLLDASGIDNRILRFEITETEQLQANETELRLVDQLRQRGYHVWLDDFGTGYNSFDLLKRLRVHGIKIDGSFTRGLLRDPIDRALTEAIVSIGKVMNLEIVAEGVEDEATYQALLGMGVHAFQGHLFHKAEAAVEAIRRQPEMVG
jgi:diguanylate cyclase (GGDEF)-like protein/PAS domain S-box-containing protein